MRRGRHRCAGLHGSGCGPSGRASRWGSRQKHIDRIGRLSNCLAYGPGILDLAHQSDEWVGIDDMVNAGRVMARTLAALLGR